MKNFKKVLSLVLAVVMVMGALVVAPIGAQAETTYKKVESASDIKSGKNYVILAYCADNSKYYAMGTNVPSGKTFLEAKEVTVTDGVLSGESIPSWTVKATTGGFTLENSNGFLSSKGEKDLAYVAEAGTENKEVWTFVDTEDGIRLQCVAYDAATKGGTMAFNYNNGSTPRFKTYKNYGVMDFVIYEGGEIKQNIELGDNATPEEIVNAAYEAMEKEVKLIGTFELTGVITGIDAEFNSQYNNITVTIQIGDMADKKIQCYRLTVADVNDAEALAELEGLGKDDTITVSGQFTYNNGKVQMDKGCVLKDVKKAAVQKENIELDPTTATEEDIVNAAYQAMEDGVKFNGTWSLTGVITKIDTAYNGSYKNITVTIQVGDMADKTIQCYRLTVPNKGCEAALDVMKALKVEDEITVEGTFTYYEGVVEFAAGCVLLEVNGEEVPTTSAPDTIDVISTGAGVVLVAGIAALAIVEMKKRR